MNNVCKVYWMDSRLGMSDYDYIGELSIKEYNALLMVCQSDHKKGVHWRFVRPNGVVFTGFSL